jgi:fumarate reductase subunit C
MDATRTYVRPMRGWWRHNPYYRAYIVREMSALFVALYALVLLTGLFRLSQGRAAYDGWRASLATPWAVARSVDSTTVGDEGAPVFTVTPAASKRIW